jgi:ribulose-phosphate 3-epimerase
MTALHGIAPSILAADFARLADQVQQVIEAGATVIHIDVMDGHFVPPITMGPLVVAALSEQAKEAGALLDVHLMIDRPERQVAEFARAGADVITIHAEATPHVHYTLQAIRAAGCRAGLALCPGTPTTVIEEVAADLDLALCMTVNPGWGGQPFIAAMLPKIERIRDLVGPDVAVEVDGGIDAMTAPKCAAAGASLFVAGSAVFGHADPGAAVRQIASSIA